MLKNNQTVLLYSHRRTGKTSLIFELMVKHEKTRPMVRSIDIDLYGSLDEVDRCEYQPMYIQQFYLNFGARQISARRPSPELRATFWYADV